MTKIKCSAETCIFYKKGICNAEFVQMTDFEYYSTPENEEKERLDDEMKCSTFKSINEVNNEHNHRKQIQA